MERSSAKITRDPLNWQKTNSKVVTVESFVASKVGHRHLDKAACPRQVLNASDTSCYDQTCSERSSKVGSVYRSRQMV